MSSPWKDIAEAIHERIAVNYPMYECRKCLKKVRNRPPSICPHCNRKTSWNEDSNIYRFAEESGLPLSREWVRRLVKEGKPVNAPSLMLIAWYAGVNSTEIARMLRTVGDKDFSAIIEGGKSELTLQEKTVLEIIKTLQEKNPGTLNRIADNLELLAAAQGLDILKELKKIRR